MKYAKHRTPRRWILGIQVVGRSRKLRTGWMLSEAPSFSIANLNGLRKVLPGEKEIMCHTLSKPFP